MIIYDFLKQSSIYNVLATESLISEDFRNRLSKISEIILIAMISVLVFFYFAKDHQNFSGLKNFVDSYDLTSRIFGLILLNVGIIIYSKLASFYFSSTYYFEKITENKYDKDEFYTFSAGRILYAGRKTDILHGFIDSKIGKLVLLRLNIDLKDAKVFYYSEKIDSDEKVPEPKDRILKIKDIATYLYSAKPKFVKFLNDRGITDKELLGAMDWVIYEIETKEYNAEWWRPEALAAKKSIAEDWSFGKTFILDKYSRNLINDPEVNSKAIYLSSREEEIGQIENALSKSVGSNAMLVGEPGLEKIQIVWSMCRNIKNKKIALPLQNKKPVLLITNFLISACKDKDSFENEIVKIFDEATMAGNIILVITNFAELFRYAQSLGSDLVSLTQSFFLDSSLQVVALANSSEFHQHLENNKALMNNFETVFVKQLSAEEIVKMIYANALSLEQSYKLFFTYQAMQECASSVSYYFSSGSSSDRAMGILYEISPWAKRKGIKIIGKDELLEYIEQKTNIPAKNKLTPTEKQKLLDLENLISKRVIGQKDAVIAVSNALRRARTGVRNPNKPIGSFLFLGPTGVGKTETAKALSYVFFGNEDDMMRLDMSEYQTDDAMEKLIGSFDTGKPGVFASMLREKQYGVVLLDEFEKTNKEVQNLFLQILDEGFFSDMSGQKVSTKNIIFIATSNAGAETIFSMISAGKNPKDAHDEIVSEIVGSGLFKPELINRFDSTIIFKPLDNNDLQRIAKIMLTKVSNRMTQKGLVLQISDALIDYIVKNGSNKVFGARPMNRFIQDSVEGAIANLILKGEAVPGKIIKFSIEENNLMANIL